VKVLKWGYVGEIQHIYYQGNLCWISGETEDGKEAGKHTGSCYMKTDEDGLLI
jgi:hypothetical protein